MIGVIVDKRRREEKERILVKTHNQCPDSMTYQIHAFG